MENPWKLITIGIALMTTTALVTGVTTSYLTAPRVEAQASAPAHRVAAARNGRVSEPVRTGTLAPTASPSAPASTTAPVPAPTAGCEQNDKLVRVGRDGLIGGLVGAAVGAAGGAIADGGKGAGKGAAIGGIAGATTGSLYGLYQVKTACGSILG